MLPVRGNEARCERTCSRDADLLAKNGAHRELEPVDVSGAASARLGADRRSEDRVATQRLGHSLRVGVKVEESPTTRNCGREVAQVGELEPARSPTLLDPHISGADAVANLDDRAAVRETKGAPVPRVAALLDSWNSSSGEELEDGCWRAAPAT